VAPALGQTYRALRGDGAYRDDRRIHVSDVSTLAEAHLFYSSVSWFVKAGAQDVFLKLAGQTQRQRGYGDFWGFVLVAQGSGDVMLEHGCHCVGPGRPAGDRRGSGRRMTAWDGQARHPQADVSAQQPAGSRRRSEHPPREVVGTLRRRRV